MPRSNILMYSLNDHIHTPSAPEISSGFKQQNWVPYIEPIALLLVSLRHIFRLRNSSEAYCKASPACCTAWNTSGWTHFMKLTEFINFHCSGIPKYNNICAANMYRVASIKNPPGSPRCYFSICLTALWCKFQQIFRPGKVSPKAYLQCQDLVPLAGKLRHLIMGGHPTTSGWKNLFLDVLAFFPERTLPMCQCIAEKYYVAFLCMFQNHNDNSHFCFHSSVTPKFGKPLSSFRGLRSKSKGLRISLHRLRQQG